MCLAVMALTLPVESILLQAVATPDYTQAVSSWVAGLSDSDLNAAADVIQAYPFAYRKSIMAAVAPGKRSAVWRNHIQMYIDGHPQLSADAVAALEAAIDVASPDAFANPTVDSRARAEAVGQKLMMLIGKDDTDYLLYRLGPRDGTFASIEPISQKLANWVRQSFVALARADDCECNQDFGCDGYGTFCAGGTGCAVDNTWPMCGWFWNDPCDGACKTGIKM